MKFSIMMRKLKQCIQCILYIVIISGLIACASTVVIPNREVCNETDWFELGRRDALKGHKMEDETSISKVCRPKFSNDSRYIYQNGWNRGVVEYCSDKNAFQMGRNQQAVPQICPEPLKKDFLKSYEKGLKHLGLSKDSDRIEREIQTLSLEAKRDDINGGKKLNLIKKLEKLKNQQAQISSQISSLESTVQ
jgi:hypothetical protein